jgi:hypothetical protein
MAETAAVEIQMDPSCPTAPVTFDLNEASGSAYVFDGESRMPGEVFGGASTLTGSEFSGGGDASGRYIKFDNNPSCLLASTAMTIEARIKPTGIPTDTTTNYIRRVLARDDNNTYQVSVWRNEGWANFTAPSGEASIALWVKPVDSHGGSGWKVVLSNYTGAAGASGEGECGITNDHWYLVKVVWDTNKAGGTPGSYFVPADIYVDDQGTDGTGTGENWSGYVRCTDDDQSLQTADGNKLWTDDEINSANGSFAIGVNVNNNANHQFNGLIDWITWKDSVD